MQPVVFMVGSKWVVGWGLVLSVVEEVTNGCLDRAAEWVAGGTLSQGLAPDTVFLCSEGVGYVVGSTEFWFWGGAPWEHKVITEQLDIIDGEGVIAVARCSVFARTE